MRGISEWEEQLNSFDIEERREVLRRLFSACKSALPGEGSNLNLHCHSFFSFNAHGWSPSRIAWEARKAGWYAAGLCDFDVLDGLEEFLSAGLVLGLRAVVHIETRVFDTDRENVEINSPGEPGVAYIMGAGFPRIPADTTPEARQLAELRRRATERNAAMVQRINALLPRIALDYEQDVVSLTPGGNPTERHIVRAYIRKSRDVFQQPDRVASFWAEPLECPPEEVLDLLADPVLLEETIRTRLFKRGGPGYEPPSPRLFPPIREFIGWVKACHAIPMAAWLDGTSAGEADPEELLESLRSLGLSALNIIPERNWNVKDPTLRIRKIANLDAVVKAAQRLHFPVNIGTEMNKPGLPMVDDLTGVVLRKYRDTFMRGARFMIGQSVLARYAGMAFDSDKAQGGFPSHTQRIEFFEQVGALPPLTEERAAQLLDLGEERALAHLRAEIAQTPQTSVSAT